jgi:integrase
MRGKTRSTLFARRARRGEALALRWKDVDLQKNIVRIERSLEQTKGSLRFKSPKTKNGRRNVSISRWLSAESKSHRARQDERRLAIGAGRAAVA